jgi:acyl carrier protein
MCGADAVAYYNMLFVHQENCRLDMVEEVKNLLRNALQLGARADRLREDSALLGAIPELDSMAVLTVINMIEEQYDIKVADDEVSADTFSTLGSLARFLETKTGR